MEQRYRNVCRKILLFEKGEKGKRKRREKRRGIDSDEVPYHKMVKESILKPDTILYKY